jgi:2-octaprenyl-6-methoxyphenol hydroxylase
MSEPGIVIVGAGLAGLAAALLLAEKGQAVRLVGPAPSSADTRTTALMRGSVERLEAAGVWQAAREQAAPLRTMTIVDATARLVRARPVSFRAEELGLDAFGWNIGNAELSAVLAAIVSASPLVERIESTVASVACGEGQVTLGLTTGRAIAAELVVAADGRASPSREAAGIEVERWHYPQAALALNLSHARPHRDVSTEFHYETGPCTLVPLPGLRSSLVWMVDEAEAERLGALAPVDLARAVEKRAHSLLGAMSVEGPVSVWPMEGLRASTMASRRVALVGEAGHVFPPIGAQGFNLTMRDIADLADIVSGRADPGAAEVLADYAGRRQRDVASRTRMVDALNRSLLSDLLPVQLARGAGLYALERLPALRRVVMSQGLAPTSLARAVLDARTTFR